MKNLICTLFEKTHHFGLVALINSLHKQGFRGDVFAGYRGSLPNWCLKSQANPSLNWEGAKTMILGEGIKLHFLPLQTNYHFTNYKPDFLISLLNGPGKDAEKAYYFDPDITLAHSWTFFENWVESGIAVCEDTNSPLSEFHPRRTAWRNYYKNFGFELKFKNSIYVNGGFLGLSKIDFGFLNLWKKAQEEMAPVIGGLGKSSLGEGFQLDKSQMDALEHFNKTDQDALNASLEAWNGNISYLGQEGMNFKKGNHVMSHAIGTKKPWDKSFFLYFLNGRSPTPQDREYWNNMQKPLRILPAFYISLKRFSIKFSRFMGRFYSRHEF